MSAPFRARCTVMLSGSLHGLHRAAVVVASSGDDSKSAAYTAGTMVPYVMLAAALFLGIRAVYRTYMRNKFGIDRRGERKSRF